jgi:hypothetical protein
MGISGIYLSVWCLFLQHNKPVHLNKQACEWHIHSALNNTQAGLSGESLNIYMREHLDNIEWSEVVSATDQPLSWFKVY